MTEPLHVCAVSSSRADYGLLLSPMRAIQADPAFRLTLILTGQHLVKDAGDTAARARADGFDIAAEIDMGLAGDDAASLTHACGRVMDGMADALVRLRPDLLLVLGDRYEILCCAIAATLAHVPIAHLSGGDVTEGAFDEGFRHAITKLSHLHLVSNARSAANVRQLAELADRIHNVGSPGIDLIRHVGVLPRDALFAALGLRPATVNFLVTFHPVTLARDSLAQFEEVLAALSAEGDAAIVITGSNADPEGRQIDARAQNFSRAHPNCAFVASLGAERYFSALAHMDIVIGNSSSGLAEAPSFGIPTVNIGERQTGRLKADSVFDTTPRRDDIRDAIARARARGRRETVNPYGDGHSSEKIVQILKAVTDPARLLRKASAFGTAP
jgi:UDP-hydrolysing UDP-N-acetyl-D-glucosamine 2-epimerase